MAKVPYLTIGSLGALLGLNLATKIFNLPVYKNLIAFNFITESTAILSVVGLFYMFIPQEWVNWKKPLFVVLIAILLGSLWEISSFSSLFIGKEALLLSKGWFKYGVPALFFIGFPIVWLSNKMARKRKLFNISTIDWTGLSITFILSMLYTIFVLKYMIIIMNAIFKLFGGVYL